MGGGYAAAVVLTFLPIAVPPRSHPAGDRDGRAQRPARRMALGGADRRRQRGRGRDLGAAVGARHLGAGRRLRGRLPRAQAGRRLRADLDRRAVAAPQREPVEERASSTRPFRDGVVTSLSNPKLAVFFVALFPQFIDAGAPVLPATLLMAAMLAIFDFAWYTALAVMVSRARQSFAQPLRSLGGAHHGRDPDRARRACGDRAAPASCAPAAGRTPATSGLLAARLLGRCRRWRRAVLDPEVGVDLALAGLRGWAARSRGPAGCTTSGRPGRRGSWGRCRCGSCRSRSGRHQPARQRAPVLDHAIGAVEVAHVEGEAVGRLDAGAQRPDEAGYTGRTKPGLPASM